MVMGKLYVLLFFVFAGFFPCSAQVDTEFWFAPPEVSSGHGDRPVYIRIATLDEPATVQVSQPARGNAVLANVTVPAGTLQTINLGALINDLETSVIGSAMKTGIRILSSAPVTAYYEVGASWNADIFALKGRNALGSYFVIPGQNLYNNSLDYSPTPHSSFDIVATQNNTVVRIRPTRPIAGHEGKSEIVVKLNAGETYTFRKTSVLASDNAIGTLVESNKPVAVTLKDDSVINGVCRDLLGDQLVPVEVTGTEYVVLKGFLNTPEYLFITAAENNTELFVGNGAVPVRTINAGQMYRHQVTQQATYVRASKPVYVFHVTGFGCELGLAILPSINCKGSQQISFARTTTEFFGLNVLVRKEGIGHFKMNGSPALVPSTAFSAVPGTNDEWYAAQLSFSTSQVQSGQGSLISNDQYSFQVGVINGNAQSTCRYGYFSAFSTLFIGDDFDFCEGETARLDAGPGKESYQWSTGETTQSIEITNAGEYWVKIVREGCELSDTVRVGVQKGEVEIGPDVQACEGDLVRIDGKENFSWQWSDGSTGQFLETSEPGKYWVSVRDYTGCSASDTLYVTPRVYKFDDLARVDMNVVSVDTTSEDSIHVSWRLHHLDPDPNNSVSLFKAVADTEPPEFISTFSAGLTAFTDVGNLTGHNKYLYHIELTNRCGGDRLVSDVHGTMLLVGEVDTANDVVSLQWNHYAGWAQGVEKYEVWRKMDEMPGYRLLAVVPGSENGFSSTIAGDGFHHRYVVRALEAQGGRESWSNSQEFELEHPVYVPNVFTPNGDNWNEFFEIKKIGLYKNSMLLVVDRWGRKVFHANGYANNWNGEGLSTGVYYYILNLGRDDKVIKGSVSILR